MADAGLVHFISLAIMRNGARCTMMANVAGGAGSVEFTGRANIDQRFENKLIFSADLPISLLKSSPDGAKKSLEPCCKIPASCAIKTATFDAPLAAPRKKAKI